MFGVSLDTLVQIGLSLAALLMAVILHENAHGRVALLLGDPTAQQQGRLTLNPLAHIDPVGTLLLPIGMALVGLPPFGWARPVPINPGYFREPYRGMMLVALAGPFSNLALSAGSLLALRLLDWGNPGLARLSAGSSLLLIPGLSWSAQLALALFYFLFIFGLINLILALFNLLPIPPLDGSRVLTYLLPPAGRRFMGRIERFALLIAIAVILILRQFHLLAQALTPLINWWFHLTLPG